MHWSARYVGIPFLDGGRDELGCDCWGIHRLIYRNEKGIELPSYGEISADDLVAIARKIKDEKDSEVWLDVIGDPRAFDTVLMTGRRVRMVEIESKPVRADIHIGTYAGDNNVIHADFSAHSVMVPLTHPTIRHRILGYRRHRDLA